MPENQEAMPSSQQGDSSASNNLENDAMQNNEQQALPHLGDKTQDTQHIELPTLEQLLLSERMERLLKEVAEKHLPG